MTEGVTLSSSHELLFLVVFGGMVLLMLLESLAPRRQPCSDGSLFRWINNVALTLLTYYVSLSGNAMGSIAITSLVDNNDIGLLQQYEIGFLGSFLVVLLVLELFSYLVHWAFHNIPILWRIHAVHHNDTDFDVTTTYRTHPFEILLPLILSIPLHILLGAPIEAVIIYQLWRIAMSLFSHSNLYIPETLDRVLRKVIVTPDFHRNHHCSDQRYTDSNYSVSIPWFDYIFGTATNRPFAEQQSMQIGLEYFRNNKDSRLDQLLLIPFRLHGFRRP